MLTLTTSFHVGELAEYYISQEGSSIQMKVVLEKGEIIEEGTHQELLAKKGFYFDISQSQNKSI